MALKAMAEPYHHVPNDILTLFVSGTLLGIGMVQSYPTPDHPVDSPSLAITASSPLPATHVQPGTPLFLHSNIVKWSMRNFLCDPSCKPAKYNPKPIYHRGDARSPVHEHLRDRKRLFATEQLRAVNADPEPLMWRCLEHSACRSPAWRNATLCATARRHMETAFGTRFEARRSGWRSQGPEEVCIVDPSA